MRSETRYVDCGVAELAFEGSYCLAAGQLHADVSLIIVLIIVQFDLPDLSAQGNDVRAVPDEFERGGLVQSPRDNGESTMSIDLEQLAGIRICWRALRAAGREVALCQGEAAFCAEFNIHEEPTSAGNLG